MSLARHTMKGLGAGRLAIGLALVVAPRTAARRWLGDAADTDGGAVAVRALGARDALLGFMAMHVASSDDPMIAARWSSAIAACDLVDGVATAAAGRRGRLGAQASPVVGLALGAAAAGLAVSAALRSGAAAAA